MVGILETSVSNYLTLRKNPDDENILMEIILYKSFCLWYLLRHFL
jgi:hypothetical protein